MSAGVSRFKIREVVQAKPVLVAEVEMLDDPEDNSEMVCSPSVHSTSRSDSMSQLMKLYSDKSVVQAKELAQEVAQLFKSVLQLNIKMKNISATQVQCSVEPGYCCQRGSA